MLGYHPVSMCASGADHSTNGSGDADATTDSTKCAEWSVNVAWAISASGNMPSLRGRKGYSSWYYLPGVLWQGSSEGLMAQMSDYAPGNRLHCGSEHHPKNLSRDTMYFIEENQGLFIFACKLCTEIRRTMQIHAIMKNHNAVEIYRNTRKATSIDRDNRGRIVSFK
jgi:hypothetical protein